MGWQGLAGTLVETERVVQKELSYAARAKPREATPVSHTAESEAPITIETVPPEKCRLRRRTRHRLHGIPHKFGDMTQVNHRRHIQSQWVSQR